MLVNRADNRFNPAATKKESSKGKGKGSGKSDDQDTSFTNTNISAGNTATIKSGGDTNLIGATVEANQIKADIGGSLKIESLQDKSSYTSNQKSMGASISIPITGSGSPGASVSASKSNVESNLQSVGQQSGLKAGDGGFQVSVNNNTDLKGGVIASTQQAINDNKNTFTTGDALSITDVQNTASFKGTAVGVSAGFSDGKPSGGAGTGSTGGNAASTSSAGISGIAGNTAVRSTDTETGIKPIFDADKVQKEINAQVAITQAFGQQASKAIGDHAATQVNEAARLRIRANGVDANDPERTRLRNEAAAIEAKWGDNGTLRLLAHTVVGGLTGGASGAAGAAAGTLAAPLAADALRSAGVDGPLATTITALAGTAAGALAGGTAGAAAGFNEVVNNYLNHVRPSMLRLSEKERYDKAAVACSSGDKSSCGTRDELAALSAQRDRDLQQACGAQSSRAACDVQVNQAKEMGNIVSGTYSQGAVAYTSDAQSPTRALRSSTIGAINDVRPGTFHGQVSKSTAEALLLGGVSAGSLAAFESALANGKNIFQAYQAAQQAHNLGTAAVTGAGVGVTLYGGGEMAKSMIWMFKNDATLPSAFQHWQENLSAFDAINSAAWGATGAAATTQMFRWGGIANDSIFKQIANPTIPVIVIRGNTMATGQAGKAVTDAAMNPKKPEGN